MRKFKSTLPTAQGLKFFDKYLETELSAEIFDAMQAIVSGLDDLTEGFVLSGGTVTGSSPNAAINESIVALNGKLLRLPATSGQTYPFYIAEAAATEINGDFGDLTSQPAIDNEFAECVSSIPGAGQYITVSAAGEYRKGAVSRRMAEDNGQTLKTAIIEIGDWNMDTLGQVTIPHGLTISSYQDIKSVSVMIRNDDDNKLTDLTSQNGGVVDATATDIILQRTGAGLFDSPFYDATSYNRGFITIQYVG